MALAPPLPQHRITHILANLQVVAITFLTAVFFASFALGGYAVFSAQVSANAAEAPARTIALFIFALPIVLPAPWSLGDVFSILWIMYLFLFVITFHGPERSFARVLSRPSFDGVNPGQGNGLYTTVSAFSLLVVSITVLESLQQVAGIPTGQLPETDPVVDFVLLSSAPIGEELGFRVTIVGVVALLILAGRGMLSHGLQALWRPSGHAGGRDLRVLDLAAILSGLLFGLAHLVYGPWNVGKVTTASLAGIGLGLVYVRYGLPAAVVGHWAFNYVPKAYDLFLSASELTMFENAFTVAIYAAGVATAATWASSWLLRRRPRSEPYLRAGIPSLGEL